MQPRLGRTRYVKEGRHNLSQKPSVTPGGTPSLSLPEWRWGVLTLGVRDLRHSPILSNLAPSPGRLVGTLGSVRAKRRDPSVLVRLLPTLYVRPLLPDVRETTGQGVRDPPSRARDKTFPSSMRRVLIIGECRSLYLIDLPHCTRFSFLLRPVR